MSLAYLKMVWNNLAGLQLRKSDLHARVALGGVQCFWCMWPTLESKIRPKIEKCPRGLQAPMTLTSLGPCQVDVSRWYHVHVVKEESCETALHMQCLSRETLCWYLACDGEMRFDRLTRADPKEPWSCRSLGLMLESSGSQTVIGIRVTIMAY
jgi:hypothetical protein